MGRDFLGPWDKRTEVPLLSRDKGTTGQAQNLATARNRLEQDFDILPQNGPGRDFDSLSHPGISRDKGTAGQVNFFVPGHDF